MKISTKHPIGLLVICLAVAGSASSQNLPNIQTASKRLQKDVRADGKLSEWSEGLMASNKATGIKYTIANDNKNLYLVFSSDDPTTTAKILAGGISIAINSVSGKNDTGPVITFPVTRNTYSYVETGWPVKTFKLLTDSAEIIAATSQFKEIKTLRLNGIRDSIISIYNEYGLKSGMNYLNKTLSGEFLVPLNRISISPGADSFDYSIIINGVPLPDRPAGIPMPQKFPNPVIIPPGAVMIEEKEIQFPTFLQGKYTLAKP